MVAEPRVTGLLSRLFGGRATELTWLDIAALKARLGSVLLVDVRQPEEYTTPPGHLPGAINVPLAEVPTRAPELASDGKPIVLVCKTDRRSVRAADVLLAAGLRDVAVLRGGTDGWHAQGLPLE
jgi:rhodanese-related sulfurtransferase